MSYTETLPQSILVDEEIEEAIERGEILFQDSKERKITTKELKIQPASVEVHLYPEILCPDEDSPGRFYSSLIHDSPHRLASRECALGCTEEIVTIAPNIVCEVRGKSSIGREWLFVHVTAGFVDPGFRDGQITLEFFNASPWDFVLESGMVIAQLSFARTSRSARNPYGSKAAGSHYQGQRGPTPSRRKRP